MIQRFIKESTLATIVLLWIATASPGKVLAFELVPPPYRVLTDQKEGPALGIAGLKVFVFTPDERTGDLVLRVVNQRNTRLGQPPCRIMVTDANDGILEQLNVSAHVEWAGGRDVDGDGGEELVVVHRDSLSSTIFIQDWPSRDTLLYFTMSAADYPERYRQIWDFGISIGPSVPGILPDRPALLLLPFNGFGHIPRGLLMIDPLTGEELWHYWFGGGSTRAELLDVDGDSLPEILIGSFASGNSATYESVDGPTDDAHSYLMAFHRDGRLIWRREFPGTFCSTETFQALAGTAEQPPRVLAVHTINRPQGQPQKMVLINATNGTSLTEQDLPESALSSTLFPWGAEAAGARRFLLFTPKVGVTIYDERLQHVRHNLSVRNFVGVAELGPMHGPILVGAQTSGETMLVDRSLRVLARLNESPTSFIVQRVPHEERPLLWLNAPEGIFRATVERNPDYVPRIILLTVGLLFGSGAIVAALQLRRRAQLTARRVEAERERYQAWSAMAKYMAHKTKTPLTNLRLSSQNFREELRARYGEIPEHLLHYFATFTGEADRAFKSVQSIIEFAREVPPKLEFQDLEAILRNVVEQSPHPSVVSVELHLQPDVPHASVDSERIVTVLENLISNSYKAMKSGGALTIRLSMEQDLQPSSGKGKWILITVADTGVGISPSDLPRVFESGFTTSEDGSGLGLVIAKKNIEDHGGTLDITSTLGKGTTVTIKLPVAAALPDHE